MNAWFSNVGSASRTASVTLRYMPLKQATPSGGTAGPPGAKKPLSCVSMSVSRATTSATVRSAGTRATRSLSLCMDVGQVLMGGR